MRKVFFVSALLAVLVGSCTSQQLAETMRVLTEEDTALTTGDVESGLRAALIKGVSEGAGEVSKVGGYLNNPKIKIPFPPEVVKVENTLRDIGMGSLVDDFVSTLNHGAEEAAKEAKPIFVSAIKQMTIADAWNILNGNNDEATQYLKRTTTSELTAKFSPVIDAALQQTGATRYYTQIVDKYNSIPFIQKVNPDLTAYATERAIDGLFVKIAEEEAKIRENPAARTSEILRKVFGAQNRP